VLINFLKLGRLDLLTAIGGFRLTTTRLVHDEITDSVQRQALDHAISVGGIEVVDPESTEVREAYIELREAGLGKGEASCLAFCGDTEGILLACDERAGCFHRAVSKLHLEGRIVTTRDLINLAAHEGRLSLDQANGLLADLRTRFRFSSPDLCSDEPLPPAFR